MSLINRLNRLWELSGTVDVEEFHRETKPKKRLFKRKKLATVVQDDPLDIFETENDNPSERTPTDWTSRT